MSTLTSKRSRRAAAPQAVAWAIVALLSLTACPRAPLRFGPTGQLLEPAELLAALDARDAKVRSLKGEARAAVEMKGQSGTVEQFVAAEAPASIHLEALDFFGRPLAMMATDGERFTLFDANEGLFLEGPATAANIALFLPVKLSPREATAILLGAIPRIRFGEARLELDKGRRAYKLTLVGAAEHAGLTQTLWVETEDLRPLRSELRGRDGYDLRFDDFQLISGQIFPARTKVTAVDAAGKSLGTSIDLQYKEAIVLNVPVNPGAFELTPPEKAERIELDARGVRVPRAK